MSTIDKWLVIGERRWARIIATELCAILSPKDTVMILGDSEDINFLDWWKNNPYKDRLRIVGQIEPCHHLKIGVAIVANSAYLHRSSTEIALNAGYNVISEKPLTFSEMDSNNLLAQAKKLNLKVFSTNTYLFADYLRVFQKDWIINRKFSQLDIQWADAVGESRYGQQKTYDSSIPIIYDVLPHIASLVLATHGEVKILKSEIKVSKGGSQVLVRVVCENMIINISLARNAPQRKRLIHFLGTGPDVTLDFTEEPGIVFSTEQPPVVSDLDWTAKRKPIAEMLICVKNYFEGGSIDSRLHNYVALLGNKLIDSVVEDYVEQQISFLNLPHHPKTSQDLNYVYAVKELTALKKRVLQYLSKESPMRCLALEPQKLSI